MPPTPSTATFSFPPLPPLPPFSAGANSNRRSAPPTTQPVVLAQSVRVRGRRSRVSFREDVDVAEECRVRSTSRPRSGPPAASTSSGPSVSIADRLPAAQRRSSADSFHMTRKPQLAPRPALKRASSSQPVAPIKAGRDNSGDFFDAFCAQALRYPKLSPALARLSDGSIPSPSVWSQHGNASRKSAILSTPPSALVPVVPSSSASSPSTTSPSSGGAPAGRKTRPPRSPIPSWSSAITSCPSLVSSHRASMVSTLTAPSMTSLLLSPPSPGDHLALMPSPGDHLALMPSPGFMEDAALHSPHYSPRRSLARDAADDVPDFEAHAGSVKGRGSMPMYMPTVYMLHDMSLSGESANDVADDEKPKRDSRMRPRRSEPVSVLSSYDGSPSLSPPPPPRATHRLLKLQSSLADLRMQRRVEEEKQAAAATALESHRTGRTASSLSPPRPRAPSPTIGDLVRKAPREEMLPTELDLDSGDESDLDLNLPPLNAALRSHVIPSTSRLLVAPKKGRNGDAAGADDGWSGSESEEEEFSRSVARMDMRKTSGSTLPARRILKRPSLPASRVSRYSDFGMPELPSPSAGSDRFAPSSDSSSIASRRSTANSIASTRPTGTAALINALVEQKYASTQALPRPKRFVEGWGAPEVLEDDEWPPDNGHGLETLAEAW